MNDPENQQHDTEPSGPEPNQQPVGYCWCFMCGYNAIVRSEHRANIEAQAECPCCKKEKMFSLLNFGDEIDTSINPDEPMPTYPATD